MRIFQLSWKLTSEAQEHLEQLIYVESDTTAELIQRFMILYKKYDDLTQAELDNVCEDSYLKNKGIELSELVNDINYLVEKVEEYEKAGNFYECISKEQPDMDILWSHLNCIISRILHVRYLLGEMLDPYIPELYDGKEITDYIDNKTLIDINTLTKKYIVHIK